MRNIYASKIHGKDYATRIRLAGSCCDSDPIPKVQNAGEITIVNGVQCQLMHNGVLVAKDGYYGRWMTDLIRLLRGHHEPQEERVFYQVLSVIQPGSLMVEAGAYWAYYSLWFRHQIAQSRTILIEPGREELRTALTNFSLNGLETASELAFIGAAELPSDAEARPVLSIDSIFDRYKISHIHLLHADIQGAELSMLSGAESALRHRSVDFLFVSTHHDTNLHGPCLERLRSHDYKILCEHTAADSFSFDGLIVAASPTAPNVGEINISKRSAYAEIARLTEDLDAQR